MIYPITFFSLSVERFLQRFASLSATAGVARSRLGLNRPFLMFFIVSVKCNRYLLLFFKFVI